MFNNSLSLSTILFIMIKDCCVIYCDNSCKYTLLILIHL
nr:MAG TPA: hypothetical protein [Caudoviricetes sp.]